MKKFYILMILSLLLTFALTISSYATESNMAYNQPTQINSHGIFRADGNNDGDYNDPEDVIFDAVDIYYLYTICQ